MKKIPILLLMLIAVAGQVASADEDVVSTDEEGIVDKASRGIQKGGEAAGRGIEKGANATGEALKKGGKATVKGVKKAGEWVGKKLQEGGEKLEKVSK